MMRGAHVVKCDTVCVEHAPSPTVACLKYL